MLSSRPYPLDFGLPVGQPNPPRSSSFAWRVGWAWARLLSLTSHRPSEHHTVPSAERTVLTSFPLRRIDRWFASGKANRRHVVALPFFHSFVGLGLCLQKILGHFRMRRGHCLLPVPRNVFFKQGRCYIRAIRLLRVGHILWALHHLLFAEPLALGRQPLGEVVLGGVSAVVSSHTLLLCTASA